MPELRPSSAVSAASAAVRPVLRTVRRSRSAWRTSAALVSRASPGGATASWSGRAARRACDRVPFHPDFRKQSVEALIDLFFELIEVWKVQLFVEAGAKEATASRRAADQPLIDRVVAFEANPFTLRRFAKRLRRTRVDYRHLALDEASGTASFFVRVTDEGTPRADGQGSLHRRDDYEPGHQEVTVESVSLDDFFADEHGTPTALWVDVEGATANVMQGARELLRSTDAVFVEVEDEPIWSDDQWIAADLVAFFDELELVPIARDVQSPKQYNVLFVRRARVDDADLGAAIERWHRRLGDGAPIE